MKILFQGDSITDSRRVREDYHSLGDGYAHFAAQLITEKYPDKEFEFINLGTNSDQTKDLLNRMQKDIIEVQPDIVSILIGINDVWHYSEDRKWLPMERFEANYRAILSEIKTKTHAKIIMLEPFLVGNPEKEFFYEDLYKKLLVIRKLAREFADVFIPLDGFFAAAMVHMEPLTLSHDGGHLSSTGAQMVAGEYLKAISPLIEA